MRTLLTFWVFSLCTHMAWGQSASFIASSDAAGIVPGQVFQVQFELKNAQVAEFESPNFGSLKVVQGPSVSSSIQIINGRRSSSRSYTYSLTASEAGTYAIPPASVKTEEGKLLQSNPLKIEIVPITESQKKEVGEIFIELIPSDTQAFVGQQIILDYVLYSRQRVDKIYTVNEIDFSGFYRQSLNDFPRATQRTSINGKPYSKRIIQRDILFGQQSGSYELGPLFFQVEVIKDRGNAPFSFFRNTETKEVSGQSFDLLIKDPPSPAPQHFSGGVGKYTIQARATQSQVSVGEAVEVLVKVEGDGDPNILDAPRLVASPTAEVFEPQLLHEERKALRGRLVFSRSWTYLVAPQETGNFSIQGQLIYLDTEKERYDTVVTASIDCWAKPALSAPTDADENILPNEESSDTNYVLWIASGLLILLFVAALYIRFRKRRANEGSQTQILNDLKGKVEDAMKHNSPDLSSIRKELIKLRQESELEEPLRDRLEQWVRTIDQYQFSPNKDIQNIDRLLKEIKEVIRNANA